MKCDRELERSGRVGRRYRLMVGGDTTLSAASCRRPPWWDMTAVQGRDVLYVYMIDVRIATSAPFGLG